MTRTMMPMPRALRLVGLLIALGWTGSTAVAQRGAPGSLLLFPEFDSRPGRMNLVTVTNTNAYETSMRTRWQYVFASNCSSLEVVEPLGPNDTLTVVAGAHAAAQGVGYLVVSAESGGEALVHNHLAGTSVLLDAFGDQGYTVEPFAFRAPGVPGAPTDHDGDLRRDLDGLEYTRAGDQYEFARFLGQGARHQSHLVLVDLTGGAAFQTTIDLLIANDNGELFSSQHGFTCWTKVPLLGVSPVFHNGFLANLTNQAPGEVVGEPSVESGWMRLDGAVATELVGETVLLDPAFVAFLVEATTLDGRETGSPAFRVGEQSNGSLVPDGLLAGLGGGE